VALLSIRVNKPWSPYSQTLAIKRWPRSIASGQTTGKIGSIWSPCFSVTGDTNVTALGDLEPIPRLLSLHTTATLASKYVHRLERFINLEETICVFKAHWAIRGIVDFYSAGVITHDCRIGSRNWCPWLPDGLF
jgi:hypothetical protein